MHRSPLVSTICVGLLLFASPVRASVPQGFVEEHRSASLQRPVGITFASDGRGFVIEQWTGRILVVRNGRVLSTPFAHVQPIYDGNNESGLLGICLDPDFDSNGFLYVYVGQTSSRHRVIRYTAQGDVGTAPVVLIDDLPSRGVNHNGGGIGFGPDGNLYVASGDNARSSSADDPGSLRGKILRYHRSGQPASANPFPSSPVWALGLRNSFRFAFQPGTGKLFATENGPSLDDEINVIRAGANYGWPSVTGPAQRSGLVDPIMTFNPTIAPTGILFVRGTALPGLQGALLFCDYKGGRIRRLHLGGPNGETAQGISDLVTSASQVVDVAEAPDGSLWYVRLDGHLFQVRAAGSVNQAPFASFDVRPSSGVAPLDVTLDASSSSDPDGHIVSYAWDLGASQGAAHGPQVSHRYASPGTFLVRLSVTDDGGVTTTTTVDLVIRGAAGALPPAGHIESAVPASGPAPLTVRYAGHGHDDVQVLEHHWDFGDGSAPLVLASPGNNLNTTPQHTFVDPGDYIVTLTVTDDAGLTGLHSITVSASGSAPISSAPSACAAPPASIRQSLRATAWLPLLVLALVLTALRGRAS